MIRIIFVEDNAIEMSNMRRSLSVMRREWDMKFFTSAEDALIAMAERPFDVVVTDYEMGGMNGLELLALSQYQYPRAVRVLLSDAVDADGVIRSAGVAHRMLRKPCDPAELLAAIQRAYELEQRLNDPDLQSMISEVGNLPMPSRTVLQLNDLLCREETTLLQVADVVASDINLTAKLLQVVNSAYFSLAHQITDVREAVAYLGLDAVRNLCVSIEMLKEFEQPPALVESIVDEIHDHSLAVAYLARQMMPDRISGSDAYVAALLHDVGKLVIAQKMPEQFLEMHVQTMRSNLPLTEVEMEVIGGHHSDIGALLLDLWGLPTHIVEAVARHHDASLLPTTGLDIVHAVFVADAIVSGRLEASEGGWDFAHIFDDEYLKALGLTEKVETLVLP
jgi:putative nucleotidyltransferase with HDIG domain